MILPEKKAIATEIRRIMAEKQITGIDLAKSLQVSQTTMSAIRNGNASYELLAKTMETLDKW